MLSIATFVTFLSAISFTAALPPSTGLALLPNTGEPNLDRMGRRDTLSRAQKLSCLSNDAMVSDECGNSQWNGPQPAIVRRVGARRVGDADAYRYLQLRRATVAATAAATTGSSDEPPMHVILDEMVGHRSENRAGILHAFVQGL